MTIELRPHQQKGVEAMKLHNKGQLIKPTGAGKTLTMIYDAKRVLEESIQPQTIVVVGPRIALSIQLCSEFLEIIDGVEVFHCHSGEVHWDSSTNLQKIQQWVKDHKSSHKFIVTTYNSLSRLQQAEIPVDTIYFDEAHHSCKAHFFPATEYFSANASRCYFFTATRRISNTIYKPGMNDVEVYGDIICRATAPEMIQKGYIVPPKVHSIKFEVLKNNEISADRDCKNVMNTIEETDVSKVLVCVKSARQLINLLTQTDFQVQLKSQGYSCLYITSKTGAVVDGKKVNREDFFNTLNAWGKDPDKKFVVIHRSILAEGINISELEAAIFLRNMDVIEMTQTIGRVVRKGGQQKTTGLCVVPVYSKTGIATEKHLEHVVDTVFTKGEMLDSVIKK